MNLFNKKSGILLHITSLPSKFGIGDLGPEAYRFANTIKKSHQRFWQILPITLTSKLKGHSPYASISSFAGNTALISPTLLYENGYLEKKEFLAYSDIFKNKIESNHIDFTASLRYKKRILDKAFLNFQKNGGFKKDVYKKFCYKHDDIWLDKYVVFSVLKNKYSNISWNKWPDDLKDNRKIKDSHKIITSAEAQKEKFFQFVFFQQWASLKAYCNSIGLKIIGDVPIYVDYESSDVWANPEIFKLYKNKNPKFISGVPPDYFSATGQLWGNPVYDWNILKKQEFQWWIDRISHNLELFDFVRLDHFRGLVKYWEVKAGEKTAKNGKWKEAKPIEFFNFLKKKLAKDIKRLPIFAEDLGHITPDVTKIMNKYNFPGTRVILFAFGKDFPDSIHLPENYQSDCVAYTGTHDNNTVRGFFKKEAGKLERKNLNEYLQKNMDFNTVANDLMKKVSASKADLVIFPMQDILGLDEKARMNRPSTKKGNWRWKLLKSQLNIEKFETLRLMTLKNKRH